MTSRYKSKALAAAHELAQGMHAVGAITDARMRGYDEACLTAAGEATTAARGLTFDVYKDARGEWRWRLVLGTGQTIASSAASYKRKRDCLAAIEIVRAAATAEVAVG